MELTPTTPMKAFPPGRRGVLLPLDDRRTAALGIALYTASKPLVLRGQRAAAALTRAVGARALPGRVEPFTAPVPAEQWPTVLRQWRAAVGPFDGLAVYRRRQQARTGMTALLTADGQPRAVVKLREQGDTLQLEQRALAAVAERAPGSFRAPRPLGQGRVGAHHWSAQSAVFTRPHAPVLAAAGRLFDEVADCLRPLVTVEAGEAPAHQDLTPWNLRRDHTGQVWLFDWEDCGPAPAGVDRVYFAVCAGALGRPVPAESSPHWPTAAVAHCRAVITARTAGNPEDAALARALLDQLPAGPAGP